MIKKKENLSEEFLKFRKHSVIQKLASILLCICLLAVSFPLESYSSKVFAEGIEKKILSFSDLSAEIKEQIVDSGTSLDQLNLPSTLTAVCVSEQENEEEKENQEFSEEETTLYTEETIQIEPVTWISTPEYNSEVEGVYYSIWKEI